MSSLKFALFFAIIVAGCAPKESDIPQMCLPYHNQHYADQFPGPYAYDVNADVVTTKGINVDTSGISLDLETLFDKQLDEVEACLTAAFGNPIVIPPDIAEKAQCLTNTFPMPFPRSCMTVKVADDWSCSADGSQEVLPSLGPVSGCVAKGQCLDANGQPIPNCPCHWRGGIQSNAYVIALPTAYLFKDSAIRWFTGCNNPWSTPEFAKCATPSVPPLPAGQTMCITSQK